MPTATKPPKPMPPPDVPPIDPKTGRWTVPWYEYLQQMDALDRALRLEIP